MAGDRSAEQIQGDIERARVALAGAVDQIAFRTNPKRVAENSKTAALAWARTPQGKAVIGGTGAVLALMVIRRISKRRG